MEKEQLFDIAYQPIVDVKSNEIFAYEALLRPKGQSPKSCLASAEKAGRLLNLEERILRQIAKDAKDVSTVFVNLTPYSFSHNGGVAMMESLGSLLPKQVVIEITEQQPLSVDISNVAENWKEKGYRLAVDDVTQGFSRLFAIAQINPDYIKIDRTCISGAVATDVWNNILESIVGMAKNIGAKTIGEGVETKEEALLLKRLRIDYGQGYYFGKPEIGRLSKKQSFSKIL